MSLPNGLSTVTVTCGPYTDASGEPYLGTVTFTPSSNIVWAATGQLILDGDVQVKLGSGGVALVTLPATDASGLTVTNFTYDVTYNLRASDGRLRTVRNNALTIQLPSATPNVTLESLQPMSGNGGIVVNVPVVSSVAGFTGSVTANQLGTALGTGGFGAAAPDAAAGVKGLVKLTGDLGGTADAPTVPGLSSKVGTSRQVAAGTGLSGGGDLSADRTLAVTFGTTAGTVAQGNDSRIAGAAPLASPAFTGAPTAPTAAPGTNTTQVATTAYVVAAVASSSSGTTLIVDGGDPSSTYSTPTLDGGTP